MNIIALNVMQNIYVSVKLIRIVCVADIAWKIKNEKTIEISTIQIELIRVYVRLFMSCMEFI